MWRLLVICLLCGVTAHVFAATPFTEGYAEALVSGLVGTATTVQWKAGLHEGNTDVYLLGKYSYDNTQGTNLPFQYSTQGFSIGVGARQWLIPQCLSLTASAGRILTGPNKSEDDLRLGLVYGTYQRAGMRQRDWYGEAFWIGLSDDVVVTLRLRDGLLLEEDEDKRLWVYALVEPHISGSGDNGVDNRVDAGMGMGLAFLKHRVAINAELRGGFSYRGAITDRRYLDPRVVVSTNF